MGIATTLIIVRDRQNLQDPNTHSLIALTIVTKLLLTARNGAFHFISGSGNASTLTFVSARKVFSGLFRKSDSRALYPSLPASGTNNVPRIGQVSVKVSTTTG